MNEHSHTTSFPRLPLISAAALVGFALAIVTITQLGKIGAPAREDAGAVAVVERDLRFEDHADGSIGVIDTRTSSLIDTVAPGTNGFLRGTLRGLARERKREGFDQTVPFQLSETRAGHLMLKDPATGRYVDLGSFGPTNAAVFAKLLTVNPGVASTSTAANPS